MVDLLERTGSESAQYQLEISVVWDNGPSSDCLSYVLSGPSNFQATGKRVARYVIAMVRP